MTTSTRARAFGAASSLLVIGVLVLAGCSAAADDTETASTEQSSTEQQPTQQTPNGVSGLIAYSEDGLLQVQGSDEQTAVRYTDDTTVTKTVTVDASTIAVGDCVTIVTDEDGTSATSVTVSDAADDGTCSTGFGGGGFGDSEGPGGDGEMPSGDSAGERPDGAPTDMPTDAPEGAADAQGGGQGGFGQFVNGAVTAVADGTVTVESTGFGEDAETTSTEVALTSETTVTGTVDATTADIATGLCVTAVGEADDAGGYDATSLALSDADEDGECSTGFGGMGGGFPGGDRADGGAAGSDTEDGE